MSREAAKPLPVISAVEGIDSSQIALHVTPDEVIALRRPGSVIPVMLIILGILAVVSPLIYSLHQEFTRRGFTGYAQTLSWMLALLLIPTALVLIATLRRRRWERGLKLIDNTITVLTPDEAIGVTTFPLADLKDVNIAAEPSASLLGQVCRLVLVRHVGGNVVVFRGCKYEDLQNVAKSLYPRMRVRVKGFEVKTGATLQSEGS